MRVLARAPAPHPLRLFNLCAQYVQILGGYHYQQDMLFYVYNFSFRPAPPDGVVCFSIQRANSLSLFRLFGLPLGFRVGSIIKHPSGFTFSPCFPPAASLKQLYLKTAVLSSVFWALGGLFPLLQCAENITPALAHCIKRPAIKFSAGPVPLAASHT